MSDDKKPFEIQSRQKDDELYASDEVVAVGTATESPVSLIRGYGAVKFFAVSNLSFRIRVEEACDPEGPWSETDRLLSETNPAGTDQIVCTSIFPCASYMRLFIDNLAGSAMEEFEICVLGHPVGGALGEGGGGGGAGGSPGDTITTSPDTTVASSATVALATPPAHTRRMTVQVTDGDASTRIRIREAGGAAGSGIIISLLQSLVYGGADGAIGALEAENVAGPDAAVAVQFEGD
jgi:hypothetical protein